jgi:phosphoenolpyruvate synthase/pyruvate phosphate dikinase
MARTASSTSSRRVRKRCKSASGNALVERYLLKEQGKVLLEGAAIGHKIGSGPVRVITLHQPDGQVQPGDVLVTDMTDPDWEPVMKRAGPSSPTAAAAPVTPPSLPASWAFRRWSAAAMPPTC